ncbi:PepSY domain-containing protein [Methylocystis sp. JAN1]|uniref:PepSY domain-containing protein n=1 Tax=Methylocystis sp. JAN1 TaxID=3397211 RepID=UPI003FA21A43
MPAACFTTRWALAAAAFAAAFGCARAEEAAERAPPHRQCFSTAQTREKIEAHKLTDPFVCMRAAAREHGGEALGARLCRLDDFFIYEISVLRPDGRIARVLFDAATGKPHSGRKDN